MELRMEGENRLKLVKRLKKLERAGQTDNGMDGSKMSSRFNKGGGSRLYMRNPKKSRYYPQLY